MLQKYLKSLASYPMLIFNKIKTFFLHVKFTFFNCYYPFVDRVSIYFFYLKKIIFSPFLFIKNFVLSFKKFFILNEFLFRHEVLTKFKTKSTFDFSRFKAYRIYFPKSSVFFYYFITMLFFFSLCSFFNWVKITHNNSLYNSGFRWWIFYNFGIIIFIMGLIHFSKMFISGYYILENSVDTAYIASNNGFYFRKTLEKEDEKDFIYHFKHIFALREENEVVYQTILMRSIINSEIAENFDNSRFIFKIKIWLLMPIVLPYIFLLFNLVLLYNNSLDLRKVLLFASLIWLFFSLYQILTIEKNFKKKLNNVNDVLLSNMIKYKNFYLTNRQNGTMEKISKSVDKKFLPNAVKNLEIIIGILFMILVILYSVEYFVSKG